jgi:hypothetical protein
MVYKGPFGYKDSFMILSPCLSGTFSFCFVGFASVGLYLQELFPRSLSDSLDPDLLST